MILLLSLLLVSLESAHGLGFGIPNCTDAADCKDTDGRNFNPPDLVENLAMEISGDDNPVPQCLRRKALPSYITQQDVADDCAELILQIIGRGEFRWHERIDVPLLWKANLGPPRVHEGRPMQWLGSRRLCNIGIRPEPPERSGAEEDTFTIMTVLEAARDIMERCVSGRPMRTGKLLVGPKNKWATDILFPERWPVPPLYGSNNDSAVAYHVISWFSWSIRNRLPVGLGSKSVWCVK